MDVFLDGRRVCLAAEDALGDGGEATVTRYGDLALKVYRAPSKARAVKLEALLGVTPSLPDAVIAPRALVRNRRGAVIGFAMRALGPEHALLASLARRSERARRRLGSRDVAGLFLDAHATLAAIHRAGAVVGDLNDLNEMFAPGRDGASARVAFIDVDSFQIAGHACEVATEAFLDPAVYGPDLAAPVATATGAPRAFTPDNDWYAFAVLLFRSLTLVHPYGGVLAELPTLPRRAAARRSVFSPEVRYPDKIGYALETLSDELAAEMRRIFDAGGRGAFPRGALEAYSAGLIDCASCGASHPAERRRCPACASRAPAAIVTNGAGCEAEDVLEARGPFLAIAAAGPVLYAVALEGERVVLRAVGERLAWSLDLGAASADLDVALGAGIVALGRRTTGELVVRGLGPRNAGPAITTATEPCALDRPAFACGGEVLHRVARGVLLRGALAGDALDERPIASVMRGQTWLVGGDAATVGCSRAFGERSYFALVGAERRELAVAPLEGGEALLDETAVLSERAAVILRRTLRAGVERVRTDAVSLSDGARRASYVADTSRRLAGPAIHGALLSGDRLLVATDRGLVRETLGGVSDREPAEETLFAATEPFAGEGSPLALSRGGVCIAHGDRVRLLRLTR